MLFREKPRWQDSTSTDWFNPHRPCSFLPQTCPVPSFRLVFFFFKVCSVIKTGYDLFSWKEKLHNFTFEGSPSFFIPWVFSCADRNCLQKLLHMQIRAPAVNTCTVQYTGACRRAPEQYPHYVLWGWGCYITASVNVCFWVEYLPSASRGAFHLNQV